MFVTVRARGIIVSLIIAVVAGIGIDDAADGAMFGGRAGVTDHRQVGAGAKIAAAAAVMRDVPAGETWAGEPARPLRSWLRETAWLSRAALRGLKGTGGDE